MELNERDRLLESVVHTRTLVEGDHGLAPAVRDSLRRLVDHALDANPPPAERLASMQHCVYTHPSGRRAVYFEPSDPWTPYHEWAQRAQSPSVSGWELVHRYRWRADVLLLAVGKIVVSSSSRTVPPTTRSAPSAVVEVMPLEEQVRRVLTVAKGDGRYHGKLGEAVQAVRQEGFDLGSEAVQDALYRVTRGTPYRLAPPLTHPQASAPA